MGDVSLNELHLPPDLPDPAAEGRYGRLLGSLGARRGESRSLHAGARRRSCLLDGRPRPRLSRAVRRRTAAARRSKDKYYYARRPGDHPRGGHQRRGRQEGRGQPRQQGQRARPAITGSRLRAELAKKNQRLPLLGDDDDTADRNYIKEFVLARNRELGKTVRRRIRRGLPLYRSGSLGSLGPANRGVPQKARRASEVSG